MSDGTDRRLVRGGTAPRVTAIVPTLAERSRRMGLLRAIESLKDASSESVRIVVVVNGDRFDSETVAILHDLAGVLVVQVKAASLPNALEVGRGMVDTPYFCFLDDDDEYLPGAIATRVRVLDQDQGVDVVVTNGFRLRDAVDEPALMPLATVEADPLGALLRGNWMASCGGMFRASRVKPSYFTDIHPYAEWTWIAFRIAVDGLRVRGIDEPTFRIHETAGSASKSAAYRFAFLGLHTRMLKFDLPMAVKQSIDNRLKDALHGLSEYQLDQGRVLDAAWLHLRSVMSWHGIRYLPFTRHLLVQYISSWRARRSKSVE